MKKGEPGTIHAGRELLPAPELQSIEPDHGEGGQLITLRITGSNFIEGLTCVRFGEKLVAVRFISETELAAEFCADWIGYWEITCRNGSAECANSLLFRTTER